MDAGVPEEATVFFRVEGAPDSGQAEVAYVAPSDPGQLSYAVLQAVGGARLYEYRGLHRFATFREIDASTGALAAGLRHEAQHANQFNRLGPHFVELDSILRGLVGTNDVFGYEDIPSEREANLAAARFIHRRFHDDLEAMAEDSRFRQYTGDVVGVDDLLESTVAVIWQIASRDQPDAHTGRQLGEVVDELEQSVRLWQEDVESGRIRSLSRGDSQPAVVDVTPG
jgi:hypothetical protein